MNELVEGICVVYSYHLVHASRAQTRSDGISHGCKSETHATDGQGSIGFATQQLQTQDHASLYAPFAAWMLLFLISSGLDLSLNALCFPWSPDMVDG